MNMYQLIMDYYHRRKKDPPIININQRNAFITYKETIRHFSFSSVVIGFLLLVLSMLSNSMIVTLVTFLLSVTALIKILKLLSNMGKFIRINFKIDYMLIEFLSTNEFPEHATLTYFEKDNGDLEIVALKSSDMKTNLLLENLDSGLESIFSLTLYEKINQPDFVKYLFQTQTPKRLQLKSIGKKITLDTNDINLGYGISYNPVKVPHILLTGGTGSGKSILISYLILEFSKRTNIVDNILICDPKNSDLGSLSHYLGNEHVATTPNNIARVVRLVVTQMNERYEKMNKDFKYGSNFTDHEYKPIWLIFDEMGAFQASGIDKQSKAVINEVMEGIKQIILLGRQAGVFICIAAQQMRAGDGGISTDLRDNLGLRIALGANSPEGYRMAFGSATPEKLPLIKEKGAGLIYLQGSSKEKAEYWESPYFDTTQFDFIKELKLYID